MTGPEPVAYGAPVGITDWPAWHHRGRIERALPILGLGVFQVVGTHFAARNQLDRQALDALAYALVAAGSLLLLARHRYPGPVFLAVFATTLTYWLLGYPSGPIFLSLVVALFSAVLAGRRRLA
jgi:hypothetical protein